MKANSKDTNTPVLLAAVFTITKTWKEFKFLLTYKWTAASTAKLLQSCQTLCDPIDGSPQGSSVPGILQARTLEWAAISFSKEWTMYIIYTQIHTHSGILLSYKRPISLNGI